MFSALPLAPPACSSPHLPGSIPLIPLLVLSAWAKVEDEDRSFQTKLRAARDNLAVDLYDLNLAVQGFKEVIDFKDMVGAGVPCAL